MIKDLLIYIFMPLLGSSIHIIQKILFECESFLNKEEKKIKFQKPFFFTWLGSLGIFLIFIIEKFKNLFILKKNKNNLNLNIFFLISIPTILNLFSGLLSNLSSLYLNYSISLMLRSSTLIFGSIISTFYLKKNLKNFEKNKILIILISILIISISAIFNNSKTTHLETNSLTIFFFIIIRTLSKSLQAISMIIEEKIMKNSNLTPIELTGYSGIWSLIFSTILLKFENINETILLIKNNNLILFYIILSIIVFSIWYILSLIITNNSSALSRMIFDQLTIIIVWIIQIFIFFYIKYFNLNKKFLKTGEEWNNMSYLQLFGFILMIYGILIFKKIFNNFSSDSSIFQIELEQINEKI